MSAQYDSMVKRMQHGFAARNGLFATLMAMNNYTGIKQVLERPYGGFLSNFSHGKGRDPSTRPELVIDRLGKHWKIENIIIKPYASMAGTHVAIDCVRALQQEYLDRFEANSLQDIHSITIEMSEPVFKKGGWKAKQPISITGAQHNVSYAVALQLLDREVTAAQFLDSSLLSRKELWSIIEKVACNHNVDFDGEQNGKWFLHLHIEFQDKTIHKLLRTPRGMAPPMSNVEILEKWRTMTEGILDAAERQAIEDAILNLETLPDASKLTSIVFGTNIAHGPL